MLFLSETIHNGVNSLNSDIFSYLSIYLVVPSSSNPQAIQRAPGLRNIQDEPRNMTVARQF